MIRKSAKRFPYFYWLGVELMEIEQWADAEVALGEVIALSKAKDDFHFLDDARLRRGLCLKYLGRKREMEALKAEKFIERRGFSLPPGPRGLHCSDARPFDLVWRVKFQLSRQVTNGGWKVRSKISLVLLQRLTLSQECSYCVLALYGAWRRSQ